MKNNTLLLSSRALFGSLVTCLFAAGIGLAVITLANNAQAHTGATGIVKERMDGMKDMSKKSKAVTKMFKGSGDYDESLILQAADSFVMHAEAMIDLFPDTEESRTDSKTEALPKIWKDWDKFEKYVVEFNNNSVFLKSSLMDGSDSGAIEKAFKDVAKDCRQCHKAFRKPKR